jgi:Rieske Fe-S protein
MSRPLIAALALAAVSALSVTSALAATKTVKSAKTPAAAAPAPVKPAEAEPVSEPVDNLTAGQLMAADRVMVGVADCEFDQKVKIERLEGHSGNFKLTFDKHSYIVQPKETTTGAVVLVDKADTIEWLQIPKKSMLMDQKEHHRMVDNCLANEQRVATQAN